MAFTLPQEVSRHVRERACMFHTAERKPATSSAVENEDQERDSGTSSLPDIEHEEETKTSIQMLSCNECPYRTDSKAELFFHQVLHGNPVSGPSVEDDADPQSQVKKLNRPFNT